MHINTEAYLQDGRLDQNRMLQTFKRIASGSVERQYPLSRIVCQMKWASRRLSCIDDVLEFEARVNDVWCGHDDAVICVYDPAKFSGNTVIDVTQTHPMILVGGILQENPFFVPPREFIPELKQRRAEKAFSLRPGG